jgi:anti-sigma factor RsiW
MLCDQNPDTLSAYLDGELPPDQAVALQQHLSTCPHCAAQIAEQVSLRRSLIPARNRFTPNPDFKRNIQQKIRQQTAAPKRPSFSFRFMPLAIPLAAILLLGVVWLQHYRRSDAFSEVADLHINALSSSNPFDVVSSDRHTVKPWFQGKIPFSFNVPELAGTEFTLLGGKLIYLHQQPGAQLIVGMGKHKISVLIFQSSSAWNPLPTAEEVTHPNAFSVKTWQHQPLRFFIIGDTEPAEIDKLATLLQQANK